ncbi:MAG: SDR family NAD(P)-dependent oxidoreductase [Minwuia sp.]|nr:SDR family NAD(P)-dependent oxidoreductase [Minwuia sp.]
MENLSGKVAFITGGASGIGLGFARSLARRGVKLALADRDESGVQAAARALSGSGAEALAITCDVADAASVQHAADQTIDRFGKVHVVMNNAGVALSGSSGSIPLTDWRWIVDINLMGVVHGVEIFVPLIERHGEGGYIINTASMAGHWASSFMAPYTATKFAVVGYSECLAQELAPRGIGVSALCPGWVKTKIAESGRHLPSSVDGPQSDAAGPIHELINNGLSPDVVGEVVIQAMAEKRMHIFTHDDMRPVIDLRRDALQNDFGRAADAVREAEARLSETLSGTE